MRPRNSAAPHRDLRSPRKSFGDPRPPRGQWRQVRRRLPRRRPPPGAARLRAAREPRPHVPDRGRTRDRIADRRATPRGRSRACAAPAACRCASGRVAAPAAAWPSALCRPRARAQPRRRRAAARPRRRSLRWRRTAGFSSHRRWAARRPARPTVRNARWRLPELVAAAALRSPDRFSIPGGRLRCPWRRRCRERCSRDTQHRGRPPARSSRRRRINVRYRRWATLRCAQTGAHRPVSSTEAHRSRR